MMLMDGNRIEDLQRMYLLLCIVNALESLRHALSSYIQRTGQGIVMDEEKDKDMVSYLLQFKASLDTIREESFSKNENRPAELIAKFLDEKLCAGNKGKSEEELEGMLDKVLVLFRFVQGKDAFEAFYKKDLAKRLLLGKSASTDAEKSITSKVMDNIPPYGSRKLNVYQDIFKEFFLSKYCGRRLMWQNSLGHRLLKAEFPKDCCIDAV